MRTSATVFIALLGRKAGIRVESMHRVPDSSTITLLRNARKVSPSLSFPLSVSRRWMRRIKDPTLRFLGKKGNVSRNRASLFATLLSRQLGQDPRDDRTTGISANELTPGSPTPRDIFAVASFRSPVITGARITLVKR